MTPRLTFRLAAIGFAALAIVLAAAQGSRHAPKIAPAAPPAAAPAQAADPALRRCQGLGAAGAQEPACLKAWADERARFLGAGATASAGGV